MIDVERLMDEVRERAARKRAQGAYGDDVAELTLGDIAAAPSVDGAFDRLSEIALVSGNRETMASPRPVVGPLITFARRAVVKLASPFLGDIVRQINTFHVETVNQLRQLEGERMGALDARLGVVEERTGGFDEWIAAIGEIFDRLRPIETRLHPLAIPAQLQTVDEHGRKAVGYDGDGSAAGEALYREFEDVFRESEDVIRARQRVYVELLREHDPVLDVGCGRGELLDLLQEARIPAGGIDLDAPMVSVCVKKGHQVEHAEAVEYLEARPDGSLGAIFSAHVIEHFEYDHLLRFLRLAEQKIVPGGLFIAETVNPHSIIALRSFWLDLTHRAPIYPEVAALLCGLHGFETTRVMFPNGTGDLDVDRRDSGDYAVVAVKEART